jgi:hypothetical protein
MAWRRSQKLREIVVGACGLAQPEWFERFYPADLPPDWRFDYYSAAYRCAAIRPEQWPELIEQPFADDWPDGFQLYFRFASVATLADWLSQADDFPPLAGALVAVGTQAEAERLAGQVSQGRIACFAVPQSAATARSLQALGVQSCWVEPLATLAGSGELGLIEIEAPLDLRALRDRIARFAAAGAGRGDLLLTSSDPATEVEALEKLATLAELMGY